MVREKGVKPEDVLIFQGKLAVERKQKLKKEAEKLKMSDYTFKPKVNKKSAQIVKIKTLIDDFDEMENVRDEGCSTNKKNKK